jgi:hypothetical protein
MFRVAPFSIANFAARNFDTRFQAIAAQFGIFVQAWFVFVQLVFLAVFG